MKYCVYRQWKDSKLQEVLEYFATQFEAVEYSATVPKSSQYSVQVGEFV